MFQIETVAVCSGWLDAPAAAPGTNDLAVCLPSMQEGCKELRLPVVNNLNGIWEADMLTLVDACHFLKDSKHQESPVDAVLKNLP